MPLVVEAQEVAWDFRLSKAEHTRIGTLERSEKGFKGISQFSGWLDFPDDR